MQNKLQQFEEDTPTQGNSDEEPKLQQKQKKIQEQQEQQNDLMSNQDYYYFKIPKLQKNQSQLTLIGIIDSSGSMYQVWPYLVKAWNEFQKLTPYAYAICFSDSASMKGNSLSSTQRDHGGGSTNIEAGFRELMRLITTEEIKLTQQIAIIFVSDGQDNDSKTIINRLSQLDFSNILNKYQIQFTSIGYGQGFPTHMAITLRDIIHNSNPNTPFLTLVSNPQEMEWKFPTLRDFIQIGDRYQTNQEILNFPWDQQYKNFVESSDWVMAKEKELTIFLNEGQLEKKVVGKQKLDLKDVIYIGASWMQELQLKSLKQNVSKQAIMALQLLENMITKFDLNIIDYKKLTVYQRRKLLKNKDSEGEYYQVIEQIKKLANSQFISSLTDQQSAQRLQIRTQIGKYHNKAMKFAGLTLDQFEQAQSEFIKLLTENDLKGEIQQEASFVSLQNTLDVLQEDDLKEAIQECQSQYELVECFPIIGQGLYVKRTDASMINPYLTEVLSITKHHKILDSMALLQQKYEMTLQTGNGDIEKVNCLLPLFKDELIRPFIKSKLYQILMTYNVQRNVDTLFPEAYLALMSSTLIYLIYQEDSEWKTNMLEEIRLTLRKVYDDEQEMLIIRQQIQANQARQILMFENKELVTFCQDPNKILLIAFSFELMNQDVAEGIIIEIMARLNDNKIVDYFTFEVNKNFKLEKEQIHQLIYEELNRETLLQNHYSFNEVYQSLKECNEKVKIKLGQFDYFLQIDLQDNKLEFMKGRFNLAKLQKIYHFMVNKELTQNQIIQLLFHATEYDRAITRANKPIERDMTIIYNRIKGYQIQKNNIFNYDRVQLREEYKNHIYQQMVKTHQIAIPLPYKEQYEEEGVQKNQLIKNACMSKDCPYYKQVRKDYQDHIMVLSYKTFFLSDLAYSLIQENCEKEPQQIMDIIYKHNKIKAQDRYIIRRRTLYVLETIKNSQNMYKK